MSSSDTGKLTLAGVLLARGVDVNAGDQHVTGAGDPDDLDAIRRFAVAYLRREQDQDLLAFDVHFDIYYLESSLYAQGRVADIIERLMIFTTGVIGAMGYGGIVLLMAIESACIPLPSEIIMPFAGYLVFQGKMTLQGAAVAGALGCVVGSIPAYYLGMYGGRPLIEKYGKWLLVSHRELDLADRLFQRFWYWILLTVTLTTALRWSSLFGRVSPWRRSSPGMYRRSLGRSCQSPRRPRWGGGSTRSRTMWRRITSRWARTNRIC